MQISNQFDPATVSKIKKSALISLGGFVVAVIPMILPDVLEWLKQYPVAAAFVGAAGPWLVNSVREYLAGAEK